MANNLEKSKGTVVEEDIMVQSNNDSEPSRGQVNFEANFGCLSLEMLRFLCQGMGVSDVGLKQDLVSRLVSKCKGKEESCSGLFGKGKVVNLDNMNSDEAGSRLHESGLFPGAGSSTEKHETNSLEAVSHDKNQKFEGQVGNMQGFIPSIHQGHPVAPVFIQAHPSFLLTWQQVSNQQGLVTTAPAVEVSAFRAGGLFTGCVSEAV
ncbi:21512_t:CDS:2 [Cetraspora pellucida]|uniref:21512_t:CDS:1 n=1 Tax=Cetraspora pellucida TaxID=1433469 RepID=A0A9N9FDP9_9GLOM|nr:21512_t:CDS:2 [Cetraspora pellucida]